MKQYLYATIVMAAVCGVPLGIASCDKDCPVCPPPVADPVSDYNVYITGTYASEVYVYNTAQKAIVDSIHLGDSLIIRGMNVTGDGKYLLVIQNTMYDNIPEDLVRYDVETHDTTHINADFVTCLGCARIEVSNTGRYIAVSEDYGIHFIDGTTFEHLFSDTVYIESGRFTYNDSLFYCEWGSREYGIYDMMAESLAARVKFVDIYGDSPWIWGIQPTHDGSALFMFVRYSYYSNWFFSYRADLDSIGVRYRMGPPGGDLRISPDGKTVLASDPGFTAVGEMGSQMLIAANVANDGITVISPGYSEDGSFALLAGDIAFTPDSRYGIVADEEGLGFGLLDMKTLRYVDVLRSPKGFSTMDFVACQKTRK